MMKIGHVEKPVKPDAFLFDEDVILSEGHFLWEFLMATCNDYTESFQKLIE